MTLVAPSMLSADFLHLEKDVEMVNRCADLFHLDVMDGVLVPNISFGFPVIEAIARKASKPLDVHLMIVHPEKYFERFASAGASMMSFHLEAARRDGLDAASMLDSIRGLGVKAGLAINPDMPVSEVYPFISHSDFILVMSVFAGFGGQKFIPDTFGRIAELKHEISRQNSNCTIEVDGGVSPENSAELSNAGAEILVAGSSVFKSPDPAAAVAQMKVSE